MKRSPVRPQRRSVTERTSARPGTALLSVLVALAAVALVSCSETPEIPPVELGGPTGARLMNGSARTTHEAYDNAYSSLTKQHYTVRRNLEAHNQNVYAAREGMRSILRSLETMRDLAAPSIRPTFDPYLARYTGWLRDLERNTWGGSFLTDFDRVEQEVKSKFVSIEILAEFPGAPAPAPAPAAVVVPPPAAKPAPAEIPKEKVDLPASSGPAAPAAPTAAPPAGPAPARLYYKAWDRAHDDLIAGYKEKKDCRARYEDVVGALALLKGSAKPDKAAKLQIYVDYYAAVHEKTRGFTALPEKTTEKDIVDELDVAARVIRKEFNPDK